MLHAQRLPDPLLVASSPPRVINLTTFFWKENGEAVTSTSPIHPHSFLGYLCADQPLVTSAGQPLARLVPLHPSVESVGDKRATRAIILSIDNGNDALKGAICHARDPRLCTRRIVTAYAPARTLRAGEGVTTWQVNGSEPFWIGDDALVADQAESLPIGMTDERLADQRFRHFLYACLVELFMAAGYAVHPGEWQGHYDLFLSLGIPPEELDRRGPTEAVQQTLAGLLHTSCTVRRCDERDHVTTWTLHLGEIIPYPQTFGTFLAWYYTPDGLPIETEIVKHITLDIGGGHIHACQVDLLHQAAGRPKLRMSASLIGEGTIGMARAVREALRARYPGIRLSDAQAQQVLLSGAVTLEGRRVRVDEIVAQVINARTQHLMTVLLPLLQERQNFVMVTGGGSLLLSRQLRRLVNTRRAGESVLFVPGEFAPVLNAIGGYVLAQASAQRRGERQGREAADGEMRKPRE